MQVSIIHPIHKTFDPILLTSYDMYEEDSIHGLDEGTMEIGNAMKGHYQPLIGTKNSL